MVLASVGAHQVLLGRWFVLFASILIMASSGGTYVYGIYSEAIRAFLNCDQKTLNRLSFFKNLGIVPGLLNEVAPPWSVLVIGAVMNLLGYLMIYLAVTKHIAPPPPVWVICLCITVGAASQSFATMAAVVSTVKNFPDHKCWAC